MKSLFTKNQVTHLILCNSRSSHQKSHLCASLLPAEDEDVCCAAAILDNSDAASRSSRDRAGGPEEVAAEAECATTATTLGLMALHSCHLLYSSLQYYDSTTTSRIGTSLTHLALAAQLGPRFIEKTRASLPGVGSTMGSPLTDRLKFSISSLSAPASGSCILWRW